MEKSGAPTVKQEANAAKVVIKEEVAACEMENAEVRFYDVRSSKGHLPFLKKVSFCSISMYFPCLMHSIVQVLRDIPEPPFYWLDSDPRAEAAHKGIIGSN